MKILIASGGSGGHIFPAEALANELLKYNADIIFIASRRRLDIRILEREAYKKIFLSANPMPYKFGFGLFVFLCKLIFDSLYALYILMRHAPHRVVGFGGYTAGPIVLLAHMLGIKTIIHEQNVIPGRTNIFLDRFADKVAVSFSESKRHFKNKNIVLTGNPVRKESLRECRELAFSKFGINKDKITLLVMGGSQGAERLNDLVSRSVCLLPIEKKRIVQLIHIVGPKNTDEIRDLYRRNGIEAKVFDFIQNINEAYSVCDIAISRAGAATIFELAAFMKPMILIPYPAKKNNQRLNARYFAENHAAIYKDEEYMKDVELRNLIIDLIDNPMKRGDLAGNARRLIAVDGAKRLGELVLE